MKQLNLVINGKEMSFTADKKEMLRLVAKEVKEIFHPTKICVVCDKEYVSREKNKIRKYCSDACKSHAYRNKIVDKYNKDNGTNHTRYTLVRKLIRRNKNDLGNN
mgnify:CR=1 FL=1|jgi:hypothetical protein|tara:strand:- start:285 stop:599 length:315 start_codon:yes stop_codon:yes gene_type:complete